MQAALYTGHKRHGRTYADIPVTLPFAEWTLPFAEWNIIFQHAITVEFTKELSIFAIRFILLTTCKLQRVTLNQFFTLLITF